MGGIFFPFLLLCLEENFVKSRFIEKNFQTFPIMSNKFNDPKFPSLFWWYDNSEGHTTVMTLDTLVPTCNPMISLLAEFPSRTWRGVCGGGDISPPVLPSEPFRVECNSAPLPWLLVPSVPGPVSVRPTTV